MDKIIQLKDTQGNNIYPIVIDGARDVKKFDCCFGSHRGFCGSYPENTMPAFIAAVKNGYRFIETDVVQSSDGVQFLLHDATIDRTSNGSGNANSLSSTQLKSYDYGYSEKFETSFSGTSIPSLEEFLIFCKRNHCIAELDLADDSRYSDSYLQTTYDVVKKVGMLDSTFFCASKSRLQVLANIDNTVMMSVSGMTDESLMQDAYNTIKDSRWATFSCPYASITKALVYKAHSLGVAIKTWYTEGDGNDTSAHADTLFDMGVDFVLTDYVTPNAFSWLK